MIRLDKYLADAGLGSRENAKILIKKGRISVEGVDALKPELKIAEDAAVFLDGKPVKRQGTVFLMMNKPAGYLTAASDPKEKTVMELLPERIPGLMPVGRLDKDTEGLLLFTNDGAISHRLLSPKKEVPRTYEFTTATPIPAEAVDFLKQRVTFSDFTSKPALLAILGEKEGRLTVTEGKFHEVKRLMHAAGSDVVTLKRVSYGPVKLGDLPKGETRLLTEDEIAALKAAIGG